MTPRKGHLCLVRDDFVAPIVTPVAHVRVSPWTGKLPRAPRIQYATIAPKRRPSETERAMRTKEGRASLLERHRAEVEAAHLRLARAQAQLRATALCCAEAGDDDARVVFLGLHESMQLSEAASARTRATKRRARGAA